MERIVRFFVKLKHITLTVAAFAGLVKTLIEIVRMLRSN